MNYEASRGISISISAAIAKEAKEFFAEAAWARNIPAYLLLRGDDQISIFYNELDEIAQDWILDKLKKEGDRAMAGTIAGLREASRDPANIEISDLVVLQQAMGEYIRQDSIDGWLYTIGENGEHLPWLVTDIAFQEASNAPPCVAVYMTANSIPTRKDDLVRPSTRISYFFAEDIQYKKISDILATKGYMKEKPALKKAYLESMETFVKVLPKMNSQFWATGSGMEVNLDERTHFPERVLFDVSCRVINDEGLIHRRFFTRTDSPFWQSVGLNYTEIPVHPQILCFNLETHTNMWIHVDNLVEYQYDSSLREKLILPKEHRDLIDILTQDMDVLMEDIVAGKSGGTTILCKGAPGLGKTLTAEVYSEVVGRPLYRVHSGQLGVASENVEKNLEKVLKRAQRWGAVMLIDEADVYIRRRGNDIDHNAVVASFLRTLEYFHGLLFLTTNRVEDVDDAIGSRCIATIRYVMPGPNEARQIWNVLSKQFEFSLKEELVDELISHFRDISGRDIKELLKLTSKWCRQKNVTPSLDVFKTCAQFRGL